MLQPLTTIVVESLQERRVMDEKWEQHAARLLAIYNAGLKEEYKALRKAGLDNYFASEKLCRQYRLD